MIEQNKKQHNRIMFDKTKTNNQKREKRNQHKDELLLPASP